MFDPEELAQHLKKPSGEMGLKIADFMNKGNKFINLITIDNLPLKDNDKVLEMGFGNGFFIKNLLDKKENITYYGVDYSDLMVEEANKLNQDLVKKNKVILNYGDIKNQNFNENFFDIIFGINIIYFWENPIDILNSLYKILKPNGVICISIRTKERMKDLKFTNFGFNLYSIDDVVELYNKTGFKLLKSIHEIEPERVIEGMPKVIVDSACILGIKE
ncbi:MAG: class I SAM-dependent methyltransferase [Candidatus Sericytochromatia bacterium]